MYDNYNYPPGADTPDAPWNRIDPPEKEYDCSATVVLNKDTLVTTDKVYWDGDDWVMCEDVSLRDVFSDNCTDIPTLLAELVKYIDGELASNQISYERKCELVKMKESAKGWTVIDEEYEE